MEKSLFEILNEQKEQFERLSLLPKALKVVGSPVFLVGPTIGAPNSLLAAQMSKSMGMLGRYASAPIINKPKNSKDSHEEKTPIMNPHAGIYFKLQEFKILTRYKNLKGLHIDFRNTASYCTFIGLNGSGKSNVIEAISAVFHSLYRLCSLKNPRRSDQCAFEYEISYVLNEKLVEITNGKMKDGKKVTIDMLPSNIIVNYSGEDDRLWKQYYEQIYTKFCGKLMDESQGFEAPQMLYVDKSCWEIALLTLLYSEDKDAVSFVDSLFQGLKCKIGFEYNNPAFKHWEQNLARIFVEELRRKDTYTIAEFRNLIQRIEFIDRERTLFILLYQAIEGDDNRLISKVNIEFSNGSNIEGLSEGEKKLILTNAILHVLATETSLTMFDEPDSHIHIARKTELVNLLETENRYSVVSTHSPVFVEKMRCENIRFLRNGCLEDIEKLQQIKELSEGQINYLDGAFILSSKHVLIVEGNADVSYLKRAIEICSSQNDKYSCLKRLSYLPMGSADHTKGFYTDVASNTLESVEKILFIYDHDKNGKNGYRLIEKYKKVQPKINAIYYQNDYTTTLKDDQPFFIEDLFSVSSYQCVLDEIRRISNYRDFKRRTQRVCDIIKSYIGEHYTDDSFEVHYEGFKPLLDYLVNYFFPENSSQNEPEEGLYKEKEEDLLNGKTESIISVYKAYKEAILGLNPDITFSPLKHYVAFKDKDGRNILSIQIYNQKIRIVLSKKKGMIKDNKRLTQDISGKGHLGYGDYIIEKNSVKDLKEIMDFIREVYNF